MTTYRMIIWTNYKETLAELQYWIKCSMKNVGQCQMKQAILTCPVHSGWKEFCYLVQVGNTKLMTIHKHQYIYIFLWVKLHIFILITLSFRYIWPDWKCTKHFHTVQTGYAECIQPLIDRAVLVRLRFHHGGNF